MLEKKEGTLFAALAAHLTKMKAFRSRNERKVFIQQKMSFSEMARVVIEARQAIIEHVYNAIPAFNTLPLLFIVGASGSGKTTTYCFLKKNKINPKNGAYESDTENEIIGHNVAESRTFLPNIEILDDYIIVDYPGFDDTNGFLIALGIELALKALILQYQPHILLIESINIQARDKAIAEMQNRLKRFVQNPHETCILGFTKYLKNPQAIKIELIEKKERKLLVESQEQLTLEIKALNEILTEKAIMQPIELKIKNLNQQLSTLQANQTQLSDSKKKRACQLRIEKTEQKILKEIGFTKYIRLDGLENPANLVPILNTLKTQSIPSSIESTCSLDTNHEKLLSKKFTNDFIINWALQPYSECTQKEFKDFSSLEKEILGSSLINTVLAKDIGVLFHLPEMPISILNRMDQELINSCIEQYLNAVLGLQLNLNQNKLPKNTELLEKVNSLQVELCRILGLDGTPEQNIEKLVQQEKEIGLNEKSLQEWSQLPFWMKSLSYLKPKVPRALNSLYTKLYVLSSKLPKEILDFEIREAIAGIEAIKRTLKGLEEIKRVVLATSKKKEKTHCRIIAEEILIFFNDVKQTVLVEKLREQLKSLAHDVIPLADTAYKALLVLAEIKPINDVDPITREAIPDEDKILVPTGHQFSLKNLIEFHNMRNPSNEECQDKFLLNPFNKLPFPPKEAAYILKLAKKKGIEILNLKADAPAQQDSLISGESAAYQLSTVQQLKKEIDAVTMMIRQYIYVGASETQLTELKAQLTKLTKTLNPQENVENQQKPCALQPRFFRNQKLNDQKGYTNPSRIGPK
jgi:hypothetical protein